MTGRRGYGQFCPVARAAEILAERWTPLVVRELLCGSVRFNDLQRGVPQMSSSLLSRRLKELEYTGIVERLPAKSGRTSEYHLTRAGEELRPIVEGFGFWAQRWVRDDLVAKQNLDPMLLMWDIRRSVSHDGMPAGRRFVVLFDYAGVPSNKRRYWLVFDRGEVDLCMKDPGYGIDLTVASSVKTMVEIWLGHVALAQAQRSGALKLEGTRADARAFRDWFSLSLFAREPEAASA